ncbi:MAG: efflux RND transporter periplasmic adaptor subunit, partial [Parvibaculum sp.]
DHALKPGLLMTVQLLKNPRRAVVVPEEALVPVGTSNFVFVIEDNTASRREVKIGARRPGDVEILEGLREGELVVTHGTMRLRDGQKVNIIEERKQGQAIGGLMDEAATVQ